MTQPIAKPQFFESSLNPEELADLQYQIGSLSLFLQESANMPVGATLKEHLDHYLPQFQPKSLYDDDD